MHLNPVVSMKLAKGYPRHFTANIANPVLRVASAIIYRAA